MRLRNVRPAAEVVLVSCVSRRKFARVTCLRLAPPGHTRTRVTNRTIDAQRLVRWLSTNPRVAAVIWVGSFLDDGELLFRGHLRKLGVSLGNAKNYRGVHWDCEIQDERKLLMVWTAYERFE